MSAYSLKRTPIAFRLKKLKVDDGTQSERKDELRRGTMLSESASAGDYIHDLAT